MFLLSPARCDGRRAQMLLNPAASFPLAVRLREQGAPLGDLFRFASGLYFRGKLEYAQAFARGVASGRGVLVITPGLGLVESERVIRYDDLSMIASVGVTPDEPRFREPLERDVGALASTLGPDDVVVLLGSIATDKYVSVLERGLAGRLRFPVEFVGRGDMSRGGLMLRCASERRELSYVAIGGVARHGPRPPRLTPLR